MKFTDMEIKNLKPDAKQYYKREGEGFTIRVLPSGVKTWLFIYTIAGKRRQMNLGDYPDISISDARKRLTDARKAFNDGKDPQEFGFDWHKNPERQKRLAQEKKEEEAKNISLPDLIDKFIEKHSKVEKKHWEEDKRILEKDALPEWRHLKAADIKKRHVVNLLDKIVERGAPGSANNNFKLIRKMFNWAVEKDYLETTPCLGVKMPAKTEPKTRALNALEIKTLWSSLDTCSMSHEIRRALKLILVTAQRPGEVIGMHSREINGKWWTIPAERSKNGREHSVYLTTTALDLIGPLEVYDPKSKKFKPKGFIFRCPHETKEQPIHVNALAYAVRRNIGGRNETRTKQDHRKGEAYKRGPYKSKGPKPVEPNQLGVAPFTPHDLRRTANTLMAASKIIKEHRERVLNHTLEKLDGTYNLHDYDDEKQMALEALERKIINIIDGMSNNKVISIIQKSA